MTHWLRGAGSVNPHHGVEFERAPQESVGHQTVEQSPPAEPARAHEGKPDPWRLPGWSLSELTAREIELSYAGGCDAVIANRQVRHFLGPIRSAHAAYVRVGDFVWAARGGGAYWGRLPRSPSKQPLPTA